MKKNVICFKTHLLNKRIIREYQKMMTDCHASACDVVLLYDNSKEDFKPSRVGGECILFNVDDLKRLGYRVHEKQSIVWWNADYPLLHFYKKNPNYEYYWMIEYDVHFKGCWKLFFDAFSENDSDLLATHVASFAQKPQWGFWGIHNLDVKEENQRSIFFPVTRFSNRALKCLDEQNRSGKWGFCEVVVPTLLHVHGYKISDLGKTYYDPKRFRPASMISVGPILLFPKNKLYHPVGRNHWVEYIKHLIPKNIKNRLKKVLGRK